MKSSISLLAAFALALWMPAVCSAASYSVTDLGTLLGGAGSGGSSINASGQVTGTSETYVDGPAHAFLWTPTTPNGASGAMQDLGTLGGLYSYGNSINAGGQVTGRSGTSGEADYHAFLYDGTMHDLGTLPGGSFYNGTSINASGQVIGTIGNAVYGAFLYSSGSGMVNLDSVINPNPSLSGWASGGSGAAINDAGQIAGTGEHLGVGPRAFLYDGTLHDLGTLGGAVTYAVGISASGLVTGTATTTSGELHAFLYDGTMHDLGTLYGMQSHGHGVNASGQVTGTVNDSSRPYGYHAFLYTSGSGMVDLNTLIDPLSGWELRSGAAINDAGQITGTGNIGGYEHAFLLTPVPEPSSLLLGSLAFWVVAAYRGWRRRPRISHAKQPRL
jgi:probable HAF family extracellular repeat protein